MKKYLILLIFLLPVFVQAQVIEQWVIPYSSVFSGSDNANDLAVDSSGYIYIAGNTQGSSSTDCLTLKYDTDGILQWAKTYNGGSNGTDYCNAIFVDNSRNVYVTGSTYGGSTYDGDYLTIKYDSVGTQLWTARYPSVGSEAGDDIAVDNSGNVYITGHWGYTVCNTVKYSPSGSQLWYMIYHIAGYPARGNALTLDNSGNIFVASQSETYSTGYDYATIKYTPSGFESWVSRYTGPGDSTDAPTSITLDMAGNIYVTGSSTGSTSRDDIVTIKYNSIGTELWVARYNGTGNSLDIAYSIAVDYLGNTFVGGRSMGASLNYDFIVLKYDPNGNLLWASRYNGPNNLTDYGYAMMVDNSGSVYITGGSGSTTALYDYATVKYDNNGNLEWVIRYSTAVSEIAYCIGLDRYGNIFVTGTGSNDIITVKYSQAPSKPLLVSPPNNSVNISLSPVLKWTKSWGASVYRVQVSTDSLFNNLIVNDTNVIDTSWSLSGLTSNTRYWWRVNARNSIGTSGAYVSSFTTIPPAPAPPQLVSPLNNATGQNLSLALVWHKSSWAASYRVQVSADSLFQNLIVNDSTLADSTRVVSGLAPLTYYWWRVNAKNLGGTSSYSSVWKFKTIGLPAQVTLLNPPNNAVNQPTSIVFGWTGATEQTSMFDNAKILFDNLSGIDAISNYWFELTTDTVSFANLTRDSSLTDTTKSVSGLNNLTNYYWRVKAKNQVGWGQFSAWWKFTTIIAVPPMPVLVSPPNGSSGQPVSVNLIWHPSAGATSYRLQVSTDAGFSSLIINDSTVTDTIKLVSGLSQLTTYYWRVNAKNSGGTSAYSAVWNFSTQALFPNLTLKVYLEGFYSPEPLDNNGKNNKEAKDGLLVQVVDTIKIYLADSTQNYALKDSVKVVLSSSGTVTTPFTNATTGRYYIVVSHRNHLETWSKYAVSFTGGSTSSYDFTIAASQAYGDNMKQIGSVWVLYGGDPNRDGDIGALDIPIFISEFGTQGYLSCDFNGDDDVTGVDQQILIQNFGITVSRPGTVPLRSWNIINMINNQKNK